MNKAQINILNKTSEQIAYKYYKQSANAICVELLQLLPFYLIFYFIFYNGLKWLLFTKIFLGVPIILCGLFSLLSLPKDLSSLFSTLFIKFNNPFIKGVWILNIINVIINLFFICLYCKYVLKIFT